MCCCVLSITACAPCRAAAQRLVETRGHTTWRQIVESLRVVARAIDADEGSVMKAFAVAAEYAAPQRALTCAVIGRQSEDLRARLTRDKQAFELNVLGAQADAGAYTKWLVAPLGRQAMSNDEVLVDLRLALGATVLAPTSLRCAAHAEIGEKEFTCPRARAGQAMRLKHASVEAEGGDAAAHGVLEARTADTHARVCKRGGGPIATHNRVLEAAAVTMRAWGVALSTEARDLLSGSKRMDILLRGASPEAALVAVDVTRRDNGTVATLAAAEREKVAKYAPHYGECAVVYGFAFDQYGRLGPQAHSAVGVFVRCGALACGMPADMLRREMYAALGVAVTRGITAQYAAVSAANGDKSLGVPLIHGRGPPGGGGPRGISLLSEIARASGQAGLLGGVV
jgi:hypothetical protein